MTMTSAEYRADYELTFNSLRAKFFRGKINIYLYFMSWLHIDMTQVLKILPKVSQGISSHKIDQVKPITQSPHVKG